MDMQHDRRRIDLSNGDTLAVEHVTGRVTSIWPGRDGTSWIEVRERDGHDHLCHALVALPLLEEQQDEVSFAVGGKDRDTVLAWVLWRDGSHGALPGLLHTACAGAPSRIDPGVLGALALKLFSKLPAKAAHMQHEVTRKLHAALDALHAPARPAAQ
jgi:hypothetical protein